MGPTSIAPDEILDIKVKKQYYSWNRFHELINKVKKQIDIPPNLIVSIGKGGSIPGVVLAEIFECNNINLGLKEIFMSINLLAVSMGLEMLIFLLLMILLIQVKLFFTQLKSLKVMVVRI